MSFPPVDTNENHSRSEATGLADVSIKDIKNLKGDSETKRLQFFNPDEVPENLMDADLIKSYLNYISKRHHR